MNSIFKASGLYYAFCSVSGVAVMLLFSLFSETLSKETGFILQSLVAYAVQLLPLLILLKKYHFKDDMGLRPATPRNTLLAIPLAFGAYPFIQFIVDLGYLISPPDTAGSSVGSSSILLSIGPAWGVLLLAILPAIVEELIFRGFVFGVFRQRSIAVATAISSISFAVLHLNITQAIHTVLLGMLLSLIREITDSVLPCMVAHATLNGISAVMLYIPPRYLLSSEIMLWYYDFSSYISGSFAVAMAGMALLVLVYAFIKEGSRFTFDLTADMERPVISGGYIAGWSISVLLNILY